MRAGRPWSGRAPWGDGPCAPRSRSGPCAGQRRRAFRSGAGARPPGRRFPGRGEALRPGGRSGHAPLRRHHAAGRWTSSGGACSTGCPRRCSIRSSTLGTTTTAAACWSCGTSGTPSSPGSPSSAATRPGPCSLRSLTSTRRSSARAPDGLTPLDAAPRPVRAAADPALRRRAARRLRPARVGVLARGRAR